jgi:serine/threonine protein kinase
LWCQEKYCPAEESPEILDHGDWIGDIEIVNLIAVLRSAALYEARRNEHKILLKISHSGFQEKLKQEAKLLYQLQQKRRHPMLPVLLPPYEQASLKDMPYGKTVYDGKTKYYEVFEHAQGEVLRSLLIKNPQPWYQNVGWLMISLADVIAYLHQAGKLHFCLSPDILLVRFDKQGIPRVLLFDLGIADTPQNLEQIWDKHFTPPAYTAPEIIEMKGKVGPGTDVYGLGLILYEMLAGHPAYEYHLARDEDIYADILHKRPAPSGRADLKNIPEVADRAIQKDYNTRQKDILTFAKELQANFPRVPVEKKPFRINWRVTAILMGTAMAISLLLALAVIIQG